MITQISGLGKAILQRLTPTAGPAGASHHTAVITEFSAISILLPDGLRMTWVGIYLPCQRHPVLFFHNPLNFGAITPFRQECYVLIISGRRIRWDTERPYMSITGQQPVVYAGNFLSCGGNLTETVIIPELRHPVAHGGILSMVSNHHCVLVHIFIVGRYHTAFSGRHHLCREERERTGHSKKPCIGGDDRRRR